MSSFLPEGAFVGWQLDDFMDVEECARLERALAARGFAPTGRAYPRGYRDNDRQVFDDAALAAAWWRIAQAQVPPELELDGVRWRAVGLNPRFRACRYTGGQSFTIHRDGAHVAPDGRRSWLTLQLYVTDGARCTGGRTRFYADATGAREWAAVSPRAGRAIVFDHRAWHDGEPVTAGEKIVLRTDVMFERIGASLEAAEPGVIGRHEGYVWRVVERRDGGLITSGRDGTVRGWSPEWVQRLGRGSVMGLAEDTAGRVWVGTRGGWLGRIEEASGVATSAGLDCGAAVLDVCARTDGGVAAALASGEVLFVDAHGAPRERIAAHFGWAWSLAAGAEGAVLSAGEDGALMELRPGATTRALLPRGSVGLRAVAADARGGRAVVGDARGGVRVLEGARVVHEVQAHAGACTSLAVRGQTWASGGEDGATRLWRGAGQMGEWIAKDFVRCVTFLKSGQLVDGGYDGCVRMRELSTRHCRETSARLARASALP